MKKLATLFTVAALSFVISCASSDSTPEAPKPTPVTGKGTVMVPKTGGFVIEAEGGVKYMISNPEKLEKKFQKDKTKVEFSGNALGEALEITSVK